MKKLLVVLLSLCLIFALAACGDSGTLEADSFDVGFLALNGITEEEFTSIVKEDMEADPDSFTIEGTLQKDVFYDDLTSMLLALDKGDIKYVAADEPTAAYIMAAEPDKYEFHPNGITSSYSMAVASENTELLTALDLALAALEADGTLAALKEQYIDNMDVANMPDASELPVFEGADTITVVVTGDVPPMDYMTPEGKAAGFNMALLSAISEKAQLNIEVISANSASRSMMITSGKADVIFWNISVAGADNETQNVDLPQGLTATSIYLSTASGMLCKAQ